MLMPAAMLIVIVLGAIAVDLSVVQLSQREVAAAASGAANDAVTYGLDEAALRAGGAYALDPERVQRAVDLSVASGDLADEIDSVTVTPTGPDTAEVTLTMDVDYIFAKALPGGPDHTTVKATARATAERE
jgi:hypothetical protein